MREIILTVDKDANQTVKDLMGFYNMQSEAEVFGLGIKLAAIAATIENSNGEWELIARNSSGKEKKISMS